MRELIPWVHDANRDEHNNPKSSTSTTHRLRSPQVGLHCAVRSAIWWLSFTMQRQPRVYTTGSTMKRNNSGSTSFWSSLTGLVGIQYSLVWLRRTGNATKTTNFGRNSPIATTLGVYFLHGPRSCFRPFSANVRLCGAVGVPVYFPPGASAFGQGGAGRGGAGSGRAWWGRAWWGRALWDRVRRGVFGT